MAQVGTKLRAASGSNGYRSFLHWCPGCNEVHQFKVAPATSPVWSFNGDFERPSFSPSMLIYVTHTEDDDEKPLPTPRRETLCHYFIKTGAEMRDREPGLDPNKSYIDFCGDSPHALSGKVVELPDWPYAPGTYGGVDE